MKTKYRNVAPDDTGDTDANIYQTHQNANQQQTLRRQDRGNKMNDWHNWIINANPDYVRLPAQHYYPNGHFTNNVHNPVNGNVAPIQVGARVSTPSSNQMDMDRKRKSYFLRAYAKAKR
jgi:hypothetical protein